MGASDSGYTGYTPGNTEVVRSRTGFKKENRFQWMGMDTLMVFAKPLKLCSVSVT